MKSNFIGDKNLYDTYQAKLDQRIREIESSCPEILKVPKRLVNPVAMVAYAKQYLEGKRAVTWRGFEESIKTQGGLISVEVTKENLSRMMRFIDRFIKLMEKRGHNIEVNDFGTYAVIEHERFQIKFREKCNRKKIRQDRWGSVDLVPNGRLSIKLAESYSSVEWTDKNKKPIEEQLASIVASIEMRAEIEKLEREHRERYWAEQERQREIEQQKKAKVEEEQARVSILIEHSRQWQEAQTLSRFLSYIESKHCGFDITPEVEEWITWAKKVQESKDPLNQGVSTYINRFYIACDE